MVDDPFVEAINAVWSFLSWRKALTTYEEGLPFELLQQPLPQTMLYSISFVEEKGFLGLQSSRLNSSR